MTGTADVCIGHPKCNRPNGVGSAFRVENFVAQKAQGVEDDPLFTMGVALYLIFVILRARNCSADGTIKLTYAR